MEYPKPLLSKKGRECQMSKFTRLRRRQRRPGLKCQMKSKAQMSKSFDINTSGSPGAILRNILTSPGSLYCNSGVFLSPILLFILKTARFLFLRAFVLSPALSMVEGCFRSYLCFGFWILTFTPLDKWWPSIITRRKLVYNQEGCY